LDLQPTQTTTSCTKIEGLFCASLISC